MQRGQRQATARAHTIFATCRRRSAFRPAPHRCRQHRQTVYPRSLIRRSSLSPRSHRRRRQPAAQRLQALRAPRTRGVGPRTASNGFTDLGERPTSRSLCNRRCCEAAGWEIASPRGYSACRLLPASSSRLLPASPNDAVSLRCPPARLRHTPHAHACRLLRPRHRAPSPPLHPFPPASPPASP